MSRRYDAVVIGGGVLGTSTAFHLAERGLRVAVVERAYPAAGTSGASHAWVWCSTKTPGFYAQFSLASARRYRELEQRCGIDFEYTVTGGLSLIWTDEAWERAEREVAELRAAGVDVHLLTAEEAAAKEPLLSPRHIRGAIYGRDDGHINPFRVVEHFTRLARERGADFHFYTEVEGVEPVPGGWRVRTTGPELEAERLILAAGFWAPRIAEMIGFPLRVRPSRGQLMVTERTPMRLRYTVASGSMRNLRKGNLVIGRVMEPDEDENVTTYEKLQQIARTVLAMAPGLRDVRIIRSFSGIRPKPEGDGLPILGPVSGHEGVYLAASHSGVTLAAIVGLSLSELIVDGETTHDLTPYRYERTLTWS